MFAGGEALRQQGKKKPSRNFSPWSFLAKMGPIKWFCPTSRASHSEPQQLMQQAKLTTAPSDANQSPVRPDSGMRLHRTPSPRHKKWSPHCLQNRLTEDSAGRKSCQFHLSSCCEEIMRCWPAGKLGKRGAESRGKNTVTASHRFSDWDGPESTQATRIATNNRTAPSRPRPASIP
jgi:hypothetical protein